MYDPEHNNRDQLHSLLQRVQERRERLEQQRQDIDDMLTGLADVKSECERALEALPTDKPS